MTYRVAGRTEQTVWLPEKDLPQRICSTGTTMPDASRDSASLTCDSPELTAFAESPDAARLMSSEPFWHHHATSLDRKSERFAAVLSTENSRHHRESWPICSHIALPFSKSHNP